MDLSPPAVVAGLHQRSLAFFRQTSLTAGVVVIVIGVLILPANANLDTAVALVLAGCSLVLWPVARSRSPLLRLAQISAWLVLLIGLQALGAHLANYAGARRLMDWPLNGMGPATALVLSLLGTALVLRHITDPPRERLVEFFVLLATIVWFPILGAYAYALLNPRMAALAGSDVSPISAGAFMLISLGLLMTLSGRAFFSVLTRAGTGGWVARRLSIVAFLIPIAMEVVAYVGRTAGWYDAVSQTILHAVLTIIATFVVILYSAVRVQETHDTWRHTQEQLEASQSRYRSIAGSIRDGVTLIGRGRVLYANQQVGKIFGLAPGAQVGLDDFARAIPENTGWLKHLGAQAHPAGDWPQEVEFWMTHPDGARRCIQNRYSEVPQPGGETLYLVVSVDVTARRENEAKLGQSKVELEQRVAERTAELEDAIRQLRNELAERNRAEQALRESEERYRRLIEFSPDTVFIHVDGKVDFCNAACLKLFGATGAEQLIGKPVMDLVHPDYHAVVEERIRLLKGEAGHAPLLEERFVRLDGTQVDVEARAVAMTYAGRPAIQVTVRDISERKRTETKLKALSRRLLESQENERRSVAAELHDEIGQVLTAVRSNLQAVQILPDPSLSAPLLQESLAITDRALKQVRDLSLDLRPSLLDDFGLVPALEWLVERQAQRSGFSAGFSVDPSHLQVPPMLATTCFRVAQAALTNIARHAKAQNVRVELTLAPFRRGPRGMQTDLTLLIRDDGKGFDVAAALDNAARGASLGLLGMQERVWLVNGQIEIKSTPGSGAEIRACFPLVQPYAERRSRRRELQ